METLNKEIVKIMSERFGNNSTIALAMVDESVSHVHNINTLYCEGSFFIINHARSNKMKHIANNHNVAVSGEWFTAQRKDINSRFFYKPESCQISDKQKVSFSSCIDNGHSVVDYINTYILEMKLNDGILFLNGKRYKVKFNESEI